MVNCLNLLEWIFDGVALGFERLLSGGLQGGWHWCNDNKTSKVLKICDGI